MDPAPGAIDPHPDRTNEAESQQPKGSRIQYVPGSLEPMVIDQGKYDREDEPDAQPEALSFEEVELISVTVRSESAGAVKHD